MVKRPTKTRVNLVQAHLVLNGKRDEEPAPNTALYRLDGRGQPVEKLTQVRDDKLGVSEKLVNERALLGIGPDVDDLAELRGVKLLRVRAEAAIPEWERTASVSIPGNLWPQWFFEEVCVSGSVQRCLPLLRIEPPRLASRTLLPRTLGLAKTDIAASAAIKPTASSIGILRPTLPTRCRPVCDGVVEIWEKECCCRIVLPDPDEPVPWDICERFPELCNPIPIDLCERFPPLCEPLPEIPDLGPGPWPGPDPAPFQFVRFERPLARMLKLRDASVDPALQQPLSPRLLADLRTLRSLPAAEAEPFLLDRPWLHHLWCHCHAPRKIGETTLNADGSFSFCFRRSRLSINKHCHRTYAYKVRQWQENQWVEVYDGIAAHAWFTAGETADLHTYRADTRTCGDPDAPDVDHGRPYVLFERIGSTPTHRLHSPKQTTDSGIGSALPPEGGLVSKSWADDCPWASTLGFRLLFDEGMQALGATYYRISLVASDANGNPLGGATPQPFTTPRAWSKIEFNAGQYQTVAEALGPQVVNGETGLYMIPYLTGNTWLSGQYHQAWNTANKPNGRYLLLLEVFDATGNRLKPDSAPAAEAGTATAFDFLYWSTPVNFETVDHAQLAHVVWIDNLRVFGDIEDLRKNGLASSEECQFITGDGGDSFSVGFRAFHRNGPTGTSFMLDWDLDWRRGLNGGWQNLDYGIQNVPPGLDTGNPQQSAAASFSTMLSGLTPPKCAFTVALEVRAKHTNGHLRLESFDRWDFASFALEILP
jgi:hypothetical protein